MRNAFADDPDFDHGDVERAVALFHVAGHVHRTTAFCDLAQRSFFAVGTSHPGHFRHAVLLPRSDVLPRLRFRLRRNEALVPGALESVPHRGQTKHNAPPRALYHFVTRWSIISYF